MKRTFCDCCGSEYDPDDKAFDVFRGKGFEVLLPKNKPAHNGDRFYKLSLQVSLDLVRPAWINQADEANIPPDICLGCMWKAVGKADNRPKAATPDPNTVLDSYLNLRLNDRDWIEGVSKELTFQPGQTPRDIAYITVAHTLGRLLKDRG